PSPRVTASGASEPLLMLRRTRSAVSHRVQIIPRFFPAFGQNAAQATDSPHRVGTTSESRQAEFNPLPAVMKGIRIQGIFVGSRQMFEAMNKAIDVNKLHPVCDRVFPFESAQEALSYMEAGSHFGKITIQL
ncbi:MAG: zinc-binding dehydrogenase, partial [Okeania sp. SIO3B3]|nr:zinc-binding dehydrogenase [Okeania sp. SIO3B3]